MNTEGYVFTGFAALIVAIFLIVWFNPSPTITVCDAYVTRTTTEYNIPLKIFLPVTRNYCVRSHEEPNPRYRPREK